MRITLSTGEAFTVRPNDDPHPSAVTFIYDGEDSSGLRVRFIRYRSRPEELYFIRYPNNKTGMFTKGQYVTGFTVGE